MEISGNNVSKRIDNKYIIHSESFCFKEGVNGLIGANGAGKTTLIRLITKYYKLSSGKIKVDLGVYNKDLFNNPMIYYKKIGYLPQNFRGIGDFNVDEFLSYMKEIKNLSHNCDSHIKNLIEILSLNEFLKYKLKHLSGGTLRRVGILQALMNDPQILILDEPTAGLDPSERINLKNYLNDIADNRIIIVSTHIIQDIEDIANNVVILNSGKIILNELVSDALESMKGRVWRTKADGKMLQFIRKKYIVRKMKDNGNNSFDLVILSEAKPTDSAVEIKPTLEDVYLYNSAKKGERL